MAEIIFYTLAALLLITAIFVVSTGDVARAVFGFFIVLFCLAGLYVFALADFVAVTQVLVYAGGVVVLMIFALMLTEKTVLDVIRGRKKVWRTPGVRKLLLLLFCGGVLALLLTAITLVDWGSLEWIRQAGAGGEMAARTGNRIPDIGINLMSTYLLPFEVVSVFLLAALVGAAYIARARKT